MFARLTYSFFALLFVLTVFPGCGTSRNEEETQDFHLGNLIEPFTPPALEELDSRVEWIEMPVMDSLELLGQRQDQEKVLGTVKEALKLKNDSPESNAKILSALGRLPAGDEAVDWDASIIRHTAADVKSTNPIMGSSTIEFDVSGMTSFGLMGFDWKFRLFGSRDAIVSWHSSKDRMYDKVVMRKDLTWSDGKPITAHDVVFSFQVIMSEQVPVPAMRSGTDKLKWVEAYDDHTLVFFHKEPLAINTWNISFGILPKHIYEKSIYEDPTLQDSDYHVKYEKQPVVGGAYYIKKRTLGQEIILERREEYYLHNGKQVRDKPHFKEVRFRIITDPSVALLALKAGDLDEKILTPEEWRTNTDSADFYKNNTKAYGLEWVYFYFGWNNKTPFFSDVRVRKAMSYAFDHQELLSKLRYGLDEPCNGIFHRTSRWAPKDAPAPYQRDIDQAEKLLAEAGWTDHDGDGIRDKKINGELKRFEFNILVMNRPDRIAICNLLKENLEQIGIVCNVRPLEFTVLQEKTLKHEFQATFGGWGTGAYPDTGENLWKTDADRNFIEYSNPKVDALFEEGMKEIDPKRREEIFGKIHRTLYEDQPYTWLYFRNSYYGFSRRLRGYNFSPRGPYNYGPGFNSLWKPTAQ